jgi:hypothetical protein
LTFGRTSEELVDLFWSTIRCNDGETFVVHVEDKILALGSCQTKDLSYDKELYHNGQADESNVSAVEERVSRSHEASKRKRRT